MKKILISVFAGLIILMIASCKKDKVEMADGNGKSPVPPTDYVWSGCNPQPINFIGSTPAPGYDNTWDYVFTGSLDNAQADPLGQTRYVPHVGPQGTTIYQNVPNDATYTLVVDEKKGVFTLKIRTADVTTSGCKLKFNICIGNTDATSNWFLANGQYAQNPTANHATDDHVNNIYCIIFQGGQIRPGIEKK